MHHSTRNPASQNSQRRRWLAPVAICFIIGLAAAPLARAAMEAAVPVRMAEPEYPYEMKREGISGIVTVVFFVDEKGNVVDPQMQKSTNKGFEQAALNAISKWKFKPARQDGTPVKSKLAIPLQFTNADN
jgi:protein TonB